VRRRPYTEIGIRRVPCVRCGAPSVHQWNACALGGQYFGVCTDCDIALNKLVLEFMRMPDAYRLLSEYERRLAA
jgi:hypothetical protein